VTKSLNGRIVALERAVQANSDPATQDLAHRLGVSPEAIRELEEQIPVWIAAGIFPDGTCTWEAFAYLYEHDIFGKLRGKRDSGMNPSRRPA